MVAAEAGDLRYYINLQSYKGQRTQSDRTANAIRSDGGRDLIGRRTGSDRTANGIRSGSERYTMPIRELKEAYSGCKRYKKSLNEGRFGLKTSLIEGNIQQICPS